MKIVKGLILPVLALCFVFIFYGKVLIHPNSYLFADSGDGLKNYFTYIFHIKNDASYIDFAGMNYPYGESFMYTDCHPLLTVFIKLLSNISPGIAGYSIGILNFLMIISIFFTVVFIHKILTSFKINFWLAIFSAIAITSLAPQIFRVTGHLALSYSCIIPLTFYLLLQHSKSDKKLSWSLILMANNIFWFFIHGYLGMMTVFFQFSYWVISLLLNRKEQSRKIYYYLHLFLIVLLPLAFFRLFIMVTDHHTGRTDNPSGFFLYNAEPDDVFVPHHPPLGPIINSIPWLKINLEWEAWSYVGLTTILVLLALLVLWIRSKVKKTNYQILSVIGENKGITVLILSSIVLLLFAMGIPFKQLPFLLDWFPVVKQFRATGRFTWFFFFAITIFSIYAVNITATQLISNDKKWLAYTIMILAPAIYFLEGIPYHSEISKAVKLNHNYFDYSQLPDNYTKAMTAIDPTKYQAIVPLPFFYQGSESYTRPCQNDICKYSMVLAFHLNLPIMGANLTRTSVEESKNIVQILSPAFYPKLIKDDIKSDKPFLVIKSNETLTGNEEGILSRCREIYKNDKFSIFELPKNVLFENTSQSEISEFEKIKNTLLPKDGFLVSDTSGKIYYNSFENNINARSFRGKGAYSGIKKGKNTFAGFPPFSFKAGKEYVVSIWMYNNHKDALNNWLRFMVEEHNVANDTYFTTICYPEQCETISGNWSMVELRFKVNDPANTICIATKGKDEDAKIPLIADGILIRESKTNVYQVEKETNGRINVLFKNNHIITVK
jgi:hypothetical protein